ncbi:hypothetical protein PTT_19765 [Pyrenophora teres f. teres 0-1]|uniref:Uncharacterized protein n=1 Tax=Pyrenophora teres f. teres (strain 0-1) TaxID=861557 RepID=E3S9M9_PYRTT|nr:hypothetical protein PTT_19765 [Pyrenophora teres f. teres 0-1]
MQLSFDKWRCIGQCNSTGKAITAIGLPEQYHEARQTSQQICVTKRSKRTLTTLPTIYEEDEPNEPAPARPKIPDYHPPSTPSYSSYQPPLIEDWDKEPTLQVPAAQEVCIPQTLTPRRPHYQTYNASAANRGPKVRARIISSQQRSPRPIQAHAGQRHKAKPPAKGALPPLSVPIPPSYTPPRQPTIDLDREEISSASK